MLERTLGVAEAAKILGCTPKTLRVWVSQRRVPHVKIGKLVRFRPQDLADYLDQHQIPVGARK